MSCIYCNATITGDLPTIQWEENGKTVVIHKHCIDSYIVVNKDKYDPNFIKALIR